VLSHRLVGAPRPRAAPPFFPSGPALSCCGPARILGDVFGSSKREIRLRQLVEAHLHLVARVLRNAGTAEADVEDDVQRVFIALSNRLDDVHPGMERSFIIQIALHIAAHARRSAARRREVLTDSMPEVADAAAGPDEIAHRRQVRRTLDRILDGMDDDLRAVFVLYELEEMTTAEIATILGIPTGTVASRLRRAREDFRHRVSMTESLARAEAGREVG
jgi:RNA polymerase sigma-70 factor, ECF subfamily